MYRVLAERSKVDPGAWPEVQTMPVGAACALGTHSTKDAVSPTRMPCRRCLMVISASARVGEVGWNPPRRVGRGRRHPVRVDATLGGHAAEPRHGAVAARRA